jgi:hypothetical protein
MPLCKTNLKSVYFQLITTLLSTFTTYYSAILSEFWFATPTVLDEDRGLGIIVVILLLAVSVIPLLNIAGVVVRCFLDVTGIGSTSELGLAYINCTLSLLPYNI